MPEGAIIFDRGYFDKPEWLNQAKDGGFSRGPAWLDLLALTNQRATTGFVRGINIPIERAQCAYSKLGLSQRWGRTQAWVTTTLTIWEKDGRIRMVKSDNQTTIIEVTNYDVWQAALLSMLLPDQGAEREQNASKAGAEREQSETDREKDRELKGIRKREGEGEGDAAPPRIVTLEQAQKYFAESGSGYTPDQVAEQWLYYDALRDRKTGDWQKPRGQTGAMTRISDWRSELASALLRFAGNGQKKNAAARTDGRTPAMARFEISKKLEAVRERLDACHETGAPPEPGDEREERELQEQLDKMEGAE
jgi:hypothetical protein